MSDPKKTAQGWAIEGKFRDAEDSQKKGLFLTPSILHLGYYNAQGEGIDGAGYAVYTVDGAGEPDGNFEARGKLDADGTARVTSAPRSGEFVFYFEEDPTDFVVFEHKRPSVDTQQTPEVAEEAKSGFIELFTSDLATIWLGNLVSPVGGGILLEALTDQDDREAIVAWTWGTIQGDFNQEASVGQIAVNAIVGLVPVADQVLDVRDLIAACYFLFDYYSQTEEEQDKKPSALGLKYIVWLWLGLLLMLIGAVPSVGSAIKGVIKTIVAFLKKLAKSAADLAPADLRRLWEALIKVLNDYGVGNAHRWLKELPGKIPGYIDDAAKQLKEILNQIKKRLEDLLERAKASRFSRIFPDEISKRIEATLEALNKAMSDMGKHIAEAKKWLQEQLEAVFGGKHRFERKDKFQDRVRTGSDSTPTPSTRRQQGEAPPDEDVLPAKTAAMVKRLPFTQMLVRRVAFDSQHAVRTIGSNARRELYAVARAGDPVTGLINEAPGGGAFMNLNTSANELRFRRKQGQPMGTRKIDDDWFELTDVDRYIKQLKKIYSRSGNPLHPFIERKIRDYLDAKVGTRLSIPDGAPGYHAEIQAANDFLNRYGDMPDFDVGRIEVAVYYIHGKEVHNPFPRCNNCQGILKNVMSFPTDDVAAAKALEAAAGPP